MGRRPTRIPGAGVRVHTLLRTFRAMRQFMILRDDNELLAAWKAWCEANIAKGLASIADRNIFYSDHAQRLVLQIETPTNRNGLIRIVA